MYSEAVLALLTLSALLIVGKLGEEIFSKFSLIPFVGAILMGIILGPGILNVLSGSAYTEEFISLGIVFILFMAGIEEKPSGMIKHGRAIWTGVMTFSFSFAIMFSALYAIVSKDVTEDVVVALVLGMVSAGPFSRTIQEMGARGPEDHAMFMEVLTMEISAILLFALIPAPGQPTSVLGLAEAITKVAAVVTLIMLFGKYAVNKLFAAAENNLTGRETTFSLVVGIVLGFGFLARYVGFNSAIAAFFLGAFESDHVNSNAYLLEKLRALTYGFFEPMFFMGLGLYFVKLNSSILILGLLTLGLAVAVKLMAGSLAAKFLGVNRLKNFFAISHEGGVDGALLLTALEMGLVRAAIYSFVMVPVTVLALIAPLGYEGRITLEKPRPAPSIDFVRYELKRVSARELSRTLLTVSVPATTTLQEAVVALEQLHTRVLVVIDQDGKPMGYVNDHELLKAAETSGVRLLSEMEFHNVPVFEEGESADKILEVFERDDVPVVAVVDESGRLVGTVLEREVLSYLFSHSYA